jgi:hypothetical protein
MNNFCTASLAKKYAYGGRFKFKIKVLFCGDNVWTVAVRQTKFSTMTDDGHIYKFYLNIYFFNRPFENGDGGIFKLLRLM